MILNTGTTQTSTHLTLIILRIIDQSIVEESENGFTQILELALYLDFVLADEGLGFGILLLLPEIAGYF